MHNIVNKPIEYPELGEEGQFARQRGIRFGIVRVQKDKIEFDDGTGTTLRISAQGIEGFGTAGSTFEFYDSSGGTKYGTIGYSSANNGFLISSYNSGDMVMSASGKIFIDSNDVVNNMLLDAEAGIDLNAVGDITLFADGDIFLRSGTADSFYLWDGAASKQIVIDDSGGATRIQRAGSTAKTAIVPTSKGHRALYCMESPEVWFMDFCYGKKVFKKGWKFWQRDWFTKPDPLFLEVTEAPYIVMPTGHKNTAQIWGRRKGMSDKRFETKTKVEFEENNSFWQTPARSAKRRKG